MPPKQEASVMDDGRNYSAKDWLDWINTLGTTGESDAMRIDRRARYYARVTGADEMDLKQETFLRLFDGRRTVSRDTPFHAGFIGVMRSIASEEATHRRRYQQPDERGELDSPLMFTEAKSTPEDQALWRHYLPGMLKVLEQAFKDKPIVLALLRRRLSELAGEPVEPSVSLKPKEKLAATKMLKRQLALHHEAMIDRRPVRQDRGG